MTKQKCKGTTKSGKQCKLKPDSSGYCHIHNPDKIKFEEVLEVVQRVCDANSWRYSFTSIDANNWKYAIISVSRQVLRENFVTENITGELNISIDDGVRVSPTKTSFYGYGLDDLHHAIMSELGNLSWLESPKEKKKPKPQAPLAHIENICSKFHLIAKQMRQRYKNRETLDIQDEYDVQDLLHVLLTLYFNDIRPEEWTPSYAGSSSRMDFLLKKEQVVIEAKKTRKGLGSKEVGEQLIVDIAKYQSHPDCKTLICFVYDPEGGIPNPKGIENDLNRTEGDLTVKVIIAPTGM